MRMEVQIAILKALAAICRALEGETQNKITQSEMQLISKELEELIPFVEDGFYGTIKR